VVALFLSVLLLLAFLVASPLQVWTDRLPQIWQQLQQQLSQFKQPLEAIRAAREELRGIAGSCDLNAGFMQRRGSRDDDEKHDQDREDRADPDICFCLCIGVGSYAFIDDR